MLPSLAVVVIGVGLVSCLAVAGAIAWWRQRRAGAGGAEPDEERGAMLEGTGGAGAQPLPGWFGRLRSGAPATQDENTVQMARMPAEKAGM